MSCEQRKRLKGAAIILALYAVAFGVPSALLSGEWTDVLIIAMVFGLPTCYLAGCFDPSVWRTAYGRFKEHTRLH